MSTRVARSTPAPNAIPGVSVYDCRCWPIQYDKLHWPPLVICVASASFSRKPNTPEMPRQSHKSCNADTCRRNAVGIMPYHALRTCISLNMRRWIVSARRLWSSFHGFCVVSCSSLVREIVIIVLNNPPVNVVRWIVKFHDCMTRCARTRLCGFCRVPLGTRQD